jgi:hypothetical protein
MRCYICDFIKEEDPEANNWVFLHRGKEICQACFDSSFETLKEFGFPEEEEEQDNEDVDQGLPGLRQETGVGAGSDQEGGGKACQKARS